MVGYRRAVIILLCGLLQSCGSSPGNTSSSILCNPMESDPAQIVGPVIFVNGVWGISSINVQPGQTINLGVSGPSMQVVGVGGTCGPSYNFVELPCGPAPTGSYWLLPDGTQIPEYCLSRVFKVSRTVTIEWVFGIGSQQESTQIQIVVQ
jgi:hypothetical protein